MVHRLDDVVADLNHLISPLRKLLTNLELQMKTLKHIQFFGHAHVKEMSQQVEGVIARGIEELRPLVVGAGFVWLCDATDTGMLWWRSGSHELVPKWHVNNPDSDAFYDYQASEWFQLAFESEDMIIAGPFIDAWGTDDHALTPALKVLDDSQTPIGVVSADLDVHKFTERLTDILRPAKDLAILNRDGHVVAANIARLTPGLRIDAFLARYGFRTIEQVPLMVSDWDLVRIA